jgi:hypothetical protein
MPRYSGDQIYQGGMTVTPTALNYRRTEGSSNFGTRKLAWYTVWMDPDIGLAANYAENNSLYYQIVRAIQQGATTVIFSNQTGGAELFYVGTPQNSSSSPINQISQSNAYSDSGWYGLKPTNFTDNFDIVSITHSTPSAGFATAVITSAAQPFNVGDFLGINGTSDYDNGSVGNYTYATSVTNNNDGTWSVVFASTNTLDDGAGGYMGADLGYDCFMFAIADDAEPILPLGESSPGGNGTLYTGVAQDFECYCDSSTAETTIVPINFFLAIVQVLQANDISTSGDLPPAGDSFYITRCQDSFGIFPNYLYSY